MARNLRVPAVVPIALSALSFAVSCTLEPRGVTTNERIKPSYNADTGRLERITYDRNQDGRVDATAFMDGTRVVRAELDEDYNGTTDRWEHYAAMTAANSAGRVQDGSQGVLQRVEVAGRADGKVSRWEFYEGGFMQRAEEDADGDGRVDKWETWSNGSLSSVALDTRGRGTPDRRLVYIGEGEPRLELDPTSP